MSDQATPISSLPPRRLEIDELEELERSERILAIIHDDQMVDLEEPYLFLWNCVFITEDRVAGVVYDDTDQIWYRVYNQARPDAVLTDAYDAIRAVRDEESLFERHALSVEEAIFEANRPGGEETSGYEEGDSFDCPLCGDTHTVRFHEDELMKGHDTDTSQLYVECSAAKGGELIIEFQARTSSA